MVKDDSLIAGVEHLGAQKKGIPGTVSVALIQPSPKNTLLSRPLWGKPFPSLHASMEAVPLTKVMGHVCFYCFFLFCFFLQEPFLSYWNANESGTKDLPAFKTAFVSLFFKDGLD